MWYIIVSLLLLLLILGLKFRIKFLISDRDDEEFVVLYLCIYNIPIKKFVYSRDTVWASFLGLFEKREEEKPDNWFDFILHSVKAARLKIEKIDCLLNFTTDQQDLFAILTGLSNIINGITQSIHKNKGSNIHILLTVNKNRSYIECILSSRLGKITILYLKHMKENKKIEKKRRDEYAPASN